MGTTLTGTTPQDTYDSLIKVTDNGPISGTAKFLSDGLGNDSALALSTTAVGIGTSTPDSTLHVNNLVNTAYDSSNALASGQTMRLSNLSTTSGISSNLLFVATGAGGGNGIGTISGVNTATGSLAFTFATRDSGGSVTEKMRITSTGNVGIGTNSPTATLDVNSGTTNIVAALRSTDAGAFLAFADPDTTLDSGFPTSSCGVIGNNFLITTANTERMRITSDGYMRMAASTGGIQFNGDTAAANALDDYEEGTWTPTLTGSGSNPTYTATVIGTYTKIGRQVTAQMDIALDTYTAGSGIIRVSLPFTVASGMGYFQAACYVYGIDISGLYLTAEPNAGNSYLQINQIQDNAAAASLDQSAIAAGDLIRITATYFV
jgi:hypothetical protein